MKFKIGSGFLIFFLIFKLGFDLIFLDLAFFAVGLGGFYDPTVMGTSLQMLQLPPGVGEMIFAKLSAPDRGGNSSGQSAVAFAQDGKRLSDLRECVGSADFACATSSQTDIGSVCRKCQMVFPTEANCKAHQAAMCYPGIKDAKSILKLQQVRKEASKYSYSLRLIG